MTTWRLIPRSTGRKSSLDVTADLGHFIVKGMLHLRHGMDLSNWLIDAPLFVPLTAVTIYGDGGQPVHNSLAIINRSTLSAILH